jgi:hypothetical protein
VRSRTQLRLQRTPELFVRLRSKLKLVVPLMNHAGESGSSFATWLNSLKRSNGRFVGVEDRKQWKQLAHL